MLNFIKIHVCCIVSEELSVPTGVAPQNGVYHTIKIAFMRSKIKYAQKIKKAVEFEGLF